MSVDRISHTEYIFTCDECNEELEVIGENFVEAWDTARDDHGWRCFKVGNEWQHVCEDCRTS